MSDNSVGCVFPRHDSEQRKVIMSKKNPQFQQSSMAVCVCVCVCVCVHALVCARACVCVSALGCVNSLWFPVLLCLCLTDDSVALSLVASTWNKLVIQPHFHQQSSEAWIISSTTHAQTHTQTHTHTHTHTRTLKTGTIKHISLCHSEGVRHRYTQVYTADTRTSTHYT